MAAVIDMSGSEAEEDHEPLNLANMPSYNEGIDLVRDREFPMLQGIA